MVPIKECLAHRNNYGTKRSVSDIKYLVVHYTANDGDTDEANAKYYQRELPTGHKASAHYFIDDDSITISVPDGFVAYSVGGSKWNDCGTTGGGKLYGVAKNTNSLSFEMCDTVRDGQYGVSEKTRANAYEIIAQKMKQYDIDIDHVIRHFDVNGKHCPAYLMDEAAWADFKNGLMQVYNGGTAPFTPIVETPVTPTPTPEPQPETYSYEQFVRDVQSAIGVTVDGIAGPKTLGATVTVSKSKNNRHAVVRPIQKYLNSLGYDCGTADGVAGSKFDAAVKKFQTWMTNPDGEITAKGNTWKKLLKL